MSWDPPARRTPGRWLPREGYPLTPVVTRLGPEQRALKTAVIAAYRSQAAALRLTQHDLDADPAKLDFELAWRMPLELGAAGAPDAAAMAASGG